MAKKTSKKPALPVKAVSVKKLNKRERKRNQHFRDELDELKGDVLQDKLQWMRVNQDLFMRLEIGECMENEHFTHIHIDNSHSVENGGKGLEIIELSEDEKVLLFPTDTQYDDWRALYDQLMSGAGAPVIEEEEND